MPDLAEPAICRFNDFLLDKRDGLFRLHSDGGKLRFRSALAPWGSSAFWWIAAQTLSLSARSCMPSGPMSLSEPNNLTVQISALPASAGC